MEFNIEGLDEMIEKFGTAERTLPQNLSDIVNKLGLSLQGRVKNKTPVGKSYKNHTGGQLRRSWRIKKIDKFTIKVYNNTEYAVPVEYGFRTRLGKGKSEPKKGGKSVVEGRFMLQRSLEELNMDREEMSVFNSIIESMW